MSKLDIRDKLKFHYTFNLSDNVIAYSDDKKFNKNTRANYLTKDGDLAKDNDVFSALMKWGASQEPPLKENEVVNLFVRQVPYDYAQFIKQWQGYNVFMPAFNKDRWPIPALGIPPYILIKGETLRIASSKDAQEIDKDN